VSAGEVIHTASTGGQKAGNNTRLSLLPAVELLEVAELYGKGAAKYADHNWTRGYAWSLSYDALQRHLGAFWSGEEIDDGEGGTGLQHLACAAFHVLTLMYYSKHHRALDDRHIAPPQPVGTIESGLIVPTLDGWIVTQTPKLNTLPAGTEGLWQSEKSGLVYWFLDGEWWKMHPDSKWEDPWTPSVHKGGSPVTEGPFVPYVAPQED
jgi:hypothetical protein